METVNVHRAKTELSKLLKRVEAGEEIMIARDGKDVAKLVPATAPTAKSRGFGALKGLISFSDDFFDPLPEEELAAWEGAYGYTPGHPYPPLDVSERSEAEGETALGIAEPGKPPVR